MCVIIQAYFDKSYLIFLHICYNQNEGTMKTIIEEKEEYVLISISPSELTEDKDSIIQIIKQYVDNETKDFLVDDSEGLIDISVEEIDQIDRLIEKEELLIVFAGNEYTKDYLRNAGIIVVPTFTEAEDYLFIEKLERQLQKPDDEYLDSEQL